MLLPTIGVVQPRQTWRGLVVAVLRFEASELSVPLRWRGGRAEVRSVMSREAHGRERGADEGWLEPGLGRLVGA